jgi:uncharacterized membrane protein YfhO
VAAGQSVWVQESFDYNWRAYSEGRRLPMRPDRLGFMLIDAPPGTREIRLEFPTPLSNLAGRVVSGVSVFAIVTLMFINRRRG